MPAFRGSPFRVALTQNKPEVLFCGIRRTGSHQVQQSTDVKSSWNGVASNYQMTRMKSFGAGYLWTFGSSCHFESLTYASSARPLKDELCDSRSGVISTYRAYLTPILKHSFRALNGFLSRILILKADYNCPKYRCQCATISNPLLWIHRVVTMNSVQPFHFLSHVWRFGSIERQSWGTNSFSVRLWLLANIQRWKSNNNMKKHEHDPADGTPNTSLRVLLCFILHCFQ